MINHDDDIIWDLLSFRQFLEDTMRTDGGSSRRPYIVCSVMQTYYEYIACILEGKLEVTGNYYKRLNRLLSEGVITKRHFEIFNRTRLLRNKLMHNLLYKPTFDEIVEFYQLALDGQNSGSLVTQRDRDCSIVHGLICGYCYILSTVIKETVKNSV